MYVRIHGQNGDWVFRNWRVWGMIMTSTDVAGKIWVQLVAAAPACVCLPVGRNDSETLTSEITRNLLPACHCRREADPCSVQMDDSLQMPA